MDDDIKKDDLDPDDVITMIEKSIADFDSALAEWSDEAWGNYEFLAGRQYTAEEEASMTANLRPIVVFNFVDKFISVVSGVECDREMDVRYHPNSFLRSGPVEVIQEVTTSLLKQGYDLEHTEAFKDCLIQGYGWISCTLEVRDGFYNIKEVKVDPFEMGWDPDAKEKNLADANFLFRRRYMTEKEVEVEWPGKIEEVKTAGLYDNNKFVSLSSDDTDYRNNGIRDYLNRMAVIHFQWVVNREYTYYSVDGKDTGYIRSDDFNTFKSRMEKLGSFVQDLGKEPRRDLVQVYYARGILLEEITDIDCYNYYCTTGKYDLTKGYYFGLLRFTRDPQRWSNKFLSNLMHNMSTAGKGLFMEKGAVTNANMNKFEEDYARADRIKWLEDGAVSQKRFHIPDAAPMPTGLPQLLDYSMNAINNTIGVNLEMLGLADRQQSGKVESARKRAGLTVLSAFFQSRREQLRGIGRCRLIILQNYIPDNIIDSIISEINKPYSQQIKSLLFRNYYVKVDEAPSSGDVKSDVWAIIVELIPYLMNQPKIPPQFLVTLLRYSPLPAHVVDELQKIISQPPTPEQKEASRVSLEKEKAEVEKNRSNALLNLAKVEETTDHTDAIGEIINRLLEIQKVQITAGHDKEKHDMNMKKSVVDMFSKLATTEASIKQKEKSNDNR